MLDNPDGIFILPHLNVQNANTISSPLTWGFPGITAILGFVHALARKVSVDYPDLKLKGAGIICHHFIPQIYKPNKIRDAVFCLTRNPLEKEGSTPPFVEEGRAHFEISLLIKAYGDHCLVNDTQKQKIAADIQAIAQTLRIAGGSILPNGSANAHQATLIEWPNTYEHQQQQYKKIIRSLLPGFSLISREDLLVERTKELQSQQPQSTALDVLLEYASLQFEPGSYDLEADKAEWRIIKKPGWIVPIPVGYSAIAERYDPGVVLNARDKAYPFQFVENCYSLGQWLSPHRTQHIEDIFWHYHVDAENGLYVGINNPTLSMKKL